MNTEKITHVPLDMIDDPAHAVRSELDLPGIQELADDIKRHGLIEPVILKMKGDRYEIIAGHRRTTASRVAGLAVIPCIVREVTDDEALAIKLAENAHRQDIDPLDEAAFYAEVIQQGKLTAEDIGKMIGRSREFIEGRIALLMYPPILQAAITNKEISLAAAKWLAKITDERELPRILEYAVKGGITADMAENFYNHWKYTSNATGQPVFDNLEAPKMEQIARPRLTCERCQEQMDVRDSILVYVHREGCPTPLPGMSGNAAQAEREQMTA